MAYKRKTRDYWELHMRTPEGWECVTAETEHKEIRQRAREYRENQPGQYKIVKKRELIKPEVTNA